jgi:hypothetical protein
MEVGLKKLRKFNRSLKSRIIALATLVLIAHGAFVSVTHHHLLTSQDSAPGSKSLIASDRGSSPSNPKSSDDSNCPSCRLQRNFSSAISTASIVVLQFEPSPIPEISLCAAYSKSSPLFLFGRAPPA